jgi:hypothetical protein
MNALQTVKAERHVSKADRQTLHHFNHAFDALGLFSACAIAGIALGALIGWISVRRLRGGFEWGLLWLVPFGLAILMTSSEVISGDVAIAILGALAGLSFGHLAMGIGIHLRDRRSGDDRGHEARERVGPQHLIRRSTNVRRIHEMRASDLPIGVARRGRIAAIRKGDESGSHTLIVGATGAGKSTALGVLAHEYGHAGHGVLLVEAKRDPSLELQARRIATEYERRFMLVSADGPTVWNPLASGGVDETVAKLLACEVFSEPYYEAESTRFLRWVIRAMEARGTRLTLPRILELCDPDRLAAHAARSSDRSLIEELTRFTDGLTPRERTDLAGLRSRLAVLAESEFGRLWLNPDSGAGPVLDLADAIRERAVTYFRLDTERYGVVAEKVGAAVAIEIGAIASELHQNPLPTFVGIDELGALDSDHSGRLFTRARAAGFSVAVATHSLADLRAAGEAFVSDVKSTIESGIGLRMGPDDADEFARLAGQVGDWHTTERTKGLLWSGEETGTRTRGYRMRIHPSVLQNLGRAEAAVLRLDHSDKTRAQIARVVPGWERTWPEAAAGPDAFAPVRTGQPQLARLSTADRAGESRRGRLIE